MWLFNSSVGRKVVMSISGAALVLFLLFHGSMNVVAIFSEEGYNWICEFLGANWYALVATLGLAGLAAIHVLYAFVLTLLNYRARGRERYAVTDRQADVEWSSKNMLVLGIIIALGLGLHLVNFWAKMQLVELQHMAGMDVDVSGATDGVALIKYTFSKWYFVLLYLVWLGALWFHLTHGIWSALHTMGWNNNTWMSRVKTISCIFATLVVLMFASVVLYYFGWSLGASCAL